MKPSAVLESSVAGYRIFYVAQGSLSVWQPGRDGPAVIAEFSDDDRGHSEFDAYLARNESQASVMLIDVIEEEFALEVIPKLGSRDRKFLIENRSQRKYRSTPYRASVFHGRSRSNNNESSVLYSAISNNELVDPWVQIMLRHRIPLTGVHSVPMMAPQVFKRLFAVSGSAMFVAPHQGAKLRQVFIRDGRLHGARLSQSPGVAEAGYAQFVVTESMRSRRYLERNRQLGAMENFDVYVVADDVTADEILRLASGDGSTNFAFISPVAAAEKLNGPADAAPGYFEEMYISLATQRHPKHSYAKSGEDRYWKMQRVRRAFIGATVAVAAVCSILGAVMLSNGWILKKQIAGIQSQLAQLEETFRRENEKFNPIKADSHEMKLAVDTGDYILANRLPVPWVMNQLSAVLGDYPDIKVSELVWNSEVAALENVPRRNSTDAPLRIPVPEIVAVSAELTADIVPFDGNMRSAFARIDALLGDLESNTHFDEALAVEYPIDARLSSAISGDIVQHRTGDTARFRVRVQYNVSDRVVTGSGAHDEST